MSSSENGIQVGTPGGQKELVEILRERMRTEKIQTRINDEKYLREHPEIKDILDYFMHQVLLNQPGVLQQFAHEILGNADLRGQVEAHKQRMQEVKNTTLDL